MGSNWQELTIGDVCYVTDGAHSKVDRVPMGVMYLTSKNISNGTLKLENFDYISEESHIKLFTDTNRAQRKLRVGDVLMGIIGTFGNCYVYSENDHFGISSSVAILRANQDLLIPEYLYYVISSEKFKSIVEKYKGGSVQGYTNVSTIKALPISIPSVDEQRKIVKLLLPNDKKIELNKQTNQTLEKMAQTLFKSWFVDFDPVFDNALAKADFNLEALPSTWPAVLVQRATLRLQVLQDNPTLQAKLTQHNLAVAENNIALTQASQAENTHEHFPSEFECTDEPSIGINGWIPIGWEVAPVSKAIQVNPRTTLSKGTIAKFADMKSIPTSGYMVDDIIKKEFSGGAKFKQYDVLLARITPCLQNGKTALVDFLADDEVGFGSTEFIVLRQNQNISYPFIACLAREENFRAHCMQSMVGSSGRQRVQNACFNDYYLALPEESIVLNYFSEFAKPNFTKMMSNKLESQSLIKIREVLLPKLISGELQITNARITEKEEC